MSLSFLSSASSSGLFCKNKAACQTQKSLQFYLYELMNGTFYPLSNHHQFTTLLYSKAGQRLLHLLQWFPYSQNNISLQLQWSRYSCIQQYNVTVALAQINDDFMSNTASFCWVKLMIITVVYTQNTGGHLQLSKHNAWRVYTVLPLNMTFWDGAGTPVASVSASHKSFNSGSCPSCAVKVMLCLVVPETRRQVWYSKWFRELTGTVSANPELTLTH